MFFISTDLFGPYIQGKEDYEKLRRSEMLTDSNALDLAFKDQTNQGRIDSQNAGYDTTLLNYAVRQAKQPGMMALADLGAASQVDMAGRIMPNIGTFNENALQRALIGSDTALLNAQDAYARADQIAPIRFDTDLATQQNALRTAQDIYPLYQDAQEKSYGQIMPLTQQEQIDRMTKAPLVLEVASLGAAPPGADWESQRTALMNAMTKVESGAYPVPMRGANGALEWGVSRPGGGAPEPLRTWLQRNYAHYNVPVATAGGRTPAAPRATQPTAAERKAVATAQRGALVESLGAPLASPPAPGAYRLPNDTAPTLPRAPGTGAAAPDAQTILTGAPAVVPAAPAAIDAGALVSAVRMGQVTPQVVSALEAAIQTGATQMQQQAGIVAALQANAGALQRQLSEQFNKSGRLTAADAQVIDVLQRRVRDADNAIAQASGEAARMRIQHSALIDALNAAQRLTQLGIR